MFMKGAVLLLLTLLPCVWGGSTIETNKLFHNTIKRWNIDVAGSSDLGQRFKRFVKAKDSVDRTTRGVKLESLNRFSVLNDAEYEVHVGPLERQLRSNGNASLENMMMRSEGAKRLQKRSDDMPDTYSYWESDVGLNTPTDQLECGSAWAFPNVATLEALYKEQTGEAASFSQQYFYDCAFQGDGCGGGAVNLGYKLTQMRQYLVSQDSWPYTGQYQECLFDQEIESFTDNALQKLWMTSWLNLESGEANMLAGLLYSPVAFGSYVSSDLLSYSGGIWSDTNCDSDPNVHSMLLVGYTETTLRVQNSYGADWGEGGYINYARGDAKLTDCSFFEFAYVVTVTYRRELEYAWCLNKKMSTHTECSQSCEEMNTASFSGWTLAVIPTQHHSSRVTGMINEEYPGVKNDDKFNYLWIGLTDPTKTGDYTWADGFTPVNYVNVTDGGPAKYGMINKNTGKVIFKNSLTYKARGLCSRPTTCWDIGTAVTNGAVTFDRTVLTEGTGATVECDAGYLLEGNATLSCAGGEWSGALPGCVVPGPAHFYVDPLQDQRTARLEVATVLSD